MSRPYRNQNRLRSDAQALLEPALIILKHRAETLGMSQTVKAIELAIKVAKDESKPRGIKGDVIR